MIVNPIPPGSHDASIVNLFHGSRAAAIVSPFHAGVAKRRQLTLSTQESRSDDSNFFHTGVANFVKNVKIIHKRHDHFCNKHVHFSL